jgi:hypothetical protein
VPRSLGGYIRALVDRLGETDPEALARLRRVVGSRRARIRLDGEVAEVRFDGLHLEVVEQDTARPMEGEGSTDRGTVLDILDARIEATEAVVDGRIAIQGAADDVARLMLAIEILLDGSVRGPSLQALAAEFRLAGSSGAEAGRTATRRRNPAAKASERELALLRRLDLLRDGTGAP